MWGIFLCVSASQTQIQLTQEQQQILCHDIEEDHVVKVMAFAGMAAKVKDKRVSV